MIPETRYRIRTSKVVHEIFEDEVILIHFDTGTYYSLGGTAALVWEALINGVSLGAIVAGFEGHFDTEASEIESALRDFLKDLQAEDLIVEDSSPANLGAAAFGIIASGSNENGKLPFEPPVLQKYTDMQELLLLDPIHEVDESGWPHVKPDSP